MPWIAQFDFVRVYKYTDEGTFEFDWQDDFDGDSINESLWTIADNVGWDGNYSTFMKSQAFVSDGILNLEM